MKIDSNNSKLPLVSIIVPIYNVEKYVEKCIDSLLNQTYKNLQIILVDDGSKDKSGFICDKYADEDYRIKVIHKKNEGASSSRKLGMSLVTGDYVMFVDGDDWLDIDTIEQCINVVIDKPQIGCIMFSYIREYPDNSIPAHLMDNDIYLEGIDAHQKVYRRLFGLSNDELNHPERMHSFESCCMKLYSINYAKEGHFIDTKEVGSSEDALFNMYALYGVNSIQYIDKNFYHYRKVSQSLSNGYRPNLVNQWNVLFSTIDKIIIEKGLDESFMNALNNRISLSILGIGLNFLSDKDASFIVQVRRIRQYISSTRYREAIKTFRVENLPISWKVFMFASKYQLSLAVYIGLLAINYLRRIK